MAKVEDGEEFNDEDLMALFEAARWAPSSYNNQPWRFIYAKRNTESWKRFFELMAIKHGPRIRQLLWYALSS